MKIWDTMLIIAPRSSMLSSGIFLLPAYKQLAIDSHKYNNIHVQQKYEVLVNSFLKKATL
ncbi:hypothetical protein CON72_29675 [Bacillus wiedmannii]|nr:hypothetical protein CON72_29675 [Bacillus wiedmannii]